VNSMDRPIDPRIHKQRTLRRILLATLAVAIAATLLTLLLGWMRPSIQHDRIRTARAQSGEVTATLDASGLVVPETEFMLTAPLATRILSVLLPTGSPVTVGQPIMLLDSAEARRDLDRIQEQISLKENARQRANLEFDRSLSDLRTQRLIKALELKSLQYEASRNKEYFEMDLITQDSVRKSNTDVERVTIELQFIETSLTNTSKDIAARLDGLALEISILTKDLDLARERLQRTSITSERDGIVTWVNNNIGANVAEGEPVAKVADLSVFRVEATLSDVLARRLTVGLPATVRSGDTRLKGHVDKILPSVNNGIVSFQVQLEQKNHPVLRPNLRVDVHAVTDQHPQSLRLKRGPLTSVDGQLFLFVIRGKKAIRTPVKLGLSNFEVYEITEGLVDGDEVIISDMSSFRDAKEVQIR
jgi:HlyD family secretion protein